MQINLLIKSLLEYGLKRKFIHEDDYLYVLNGLLSCFQLKEFEEPELFEPLIESLDEILEKNKLFVTLKEYKESLKGKCQECTYKMICGGCRATALALKKSLLEEDPLCLL